MPGQMPLSPSRADTLRELCALAGDTRASRAQLAELLSKAGPEGLCSGSPDIAAALAAFGLSADTADHHTVLVRDFFEWVFSSSRGAEPATAPGQVPSLAGPGPQADTNPPPAAQAALPRDEAAAEGDRQGTAEEVVHALAHRSMTLGALVDFVQRTYEVMPHFDLARTKTVDVVWQVIVPETRQKGCAYANLVEGSCEQLPDRMVSHWWGNLFSHLLAAVFANALGYKDYFHILPLLELRNLSLLRAEIEERGLTGMRWWLCIFCVNQHISICGSTWGNKDSVTDKPYDACTCGRQKYTEGNLCEMDKFDDMISLFQRDKPGYSHLLALDVGELSFTRIWVIAEIAEVEKKRIHLDTVKAVQAIINNEHDIDVSNAKASRPEDEARVLGKIEDKSAFNEKVKLGVAATSFVSSIDSLCLVLGEQLDHEETRTLIRKIRNAESCEQACKLFGSWFGDFGDGGMFLCLTYPHLSLARIAGHGNLRMYLASRANLHNQMFDEDDEDRYDETESEQEFINLRIDSAHTDLGYGGDINYRDTVHRVHVLPGPTTLTEVAAHSAAFMTVIAARGGPEVLAALQEASDLLRRKPCPCSEASFPGSIAWLYCSASAPHAEAHTGMSDVFPYVGSWQGEAAASDLVDFALRSATRGVASELYEVNRPHYCCAASRGLMLMCPAEPMAADTLRAASEVAASIGVPFAFADSSTFVGRCVVRRLGGDGLKLPALVLLSGDFRPAEKDGSAAVGSGWRFVQELRGGGLPPSAREVELAARDLAERAGRGPDAGVDRDGVSLELLSLPFVNSDPY